MTFGAFLRSFKSLWGLGAAAAAVGPLTLVASDLEPPWPAGAGTLATLFCVVAILLAFALRRRMLSSASLLRGRAARGSATGGDRRLALLGAALLILGLAASLGYLWAYSTFVVTETRINGAREQSLRFVVGGELRSDVADVGKSKHDLLLDYASDPEAVWTAESLRSARLFLLTAFLLTFFLLTFGAALLTPATPRRAGSGGRSRSV
jgi:hypothetical protein